MSAVAETFEIVRAQRLTSRCSGSDKAHEVRAAASTIRSIMRALHETGLLAPPPPKDPFAGLDGEEDDLAGDDDAPAPKRPRGRPRLPGNGKTGVDLDDVLRKS